MLLVDFGLACNLNCAYCYARTSGLWGMAHDPEAQLRTISSCGLTADQEVVLHGGEPLLEPGKLFAFVDRLRAMVWDLRAITVQTNGLLLRDLAHDLVERDIRVGVSLDGDTQEMNVHRGGREVVERVLDGLYAFVSAGGEPGLIAVVTRQNIGELIRFVRHLHLELGMKSFRLNPVQLHPELSPPAEELIGLYLEAYRVSRRYRIRIDPVESLLLGARGVNTELMQCSFQGCDPLRTAVPLVLPDGSLANCLKAPAAWDPRTRPGRAEYLRALPWELGGCAGCRWWPVCKGGCPAEGIGGDPALRSYLCPVWREVRRELSQAR